MEEPNLPSWVGRAAELASVVDELRVEGGLWTVVGAPGIGKSRFCRELARSWSSDATFVDLAEVADRPTLVEELGRALELSLPESPKPEAKETALQRRLVELDAHLIVFDNPERCEPVLTAALQEWRPAAPAIRWLVSSRVRLGAATERVVELGPLEVDEDAVRLFVERARRARRDFTLEDDDDRAAAKQIVRALDGIPLAIELAAGRMRAMGVRELASRLDERFGLLGGGSAKLGHRWPTLRAAIDASWELLEPWERDALAQCSVFAGAFDAWMAEELLDLSAHAAAPEPLEVVIALRDKSLLTLEDGPKGVRLRLLQTVRDYAAERLVELGGREAAEARHAAQTLARTSEAARRLDQGDLDVRSVLLAQREQLFAVAERSSGDPEAAAEALVVLASLTETEGVSTRHERLMDRALSWVEAGELSEGMAGRLVLERSTVARARGELARSRADAERALAMAEAGANGELRGRALRRLGMLDVDAGRPDDALSRLRAAGDQHRADGDEALLAIASSSLGRALYGAGRREEAEEVCRQAVALHARVGTELWEALTQGYLAYMAIDAGRFAEAHAMLERCLEQFARLGSVAYEGAFAGVLASLHHTRGELDAAGSLFDQARQAMEKAGRQRLAAIHQGNRGIVALERGEPARECLMEAARRLQQAGDATSAALFTAWLGAACARAGDQQEARQHIERARCAAPDGSTIARAVQALAGFVDARAALADPDRAVSLLAEARRNAAEAESGESEPASDVRIALRLLEGALADAAAEDLPGASGAAATVHREGRWLMRDGAEVSFGRRPVLRRMLAALAGARAERPSEVIARDALIAATWPAQRMSVDSAATRLHATVARLRKEGLGDLLENADGGYRLALAVEVRDQ